VEEVKIVGVYDNIMTYLSIAIYESSDEIRMSSFVFCVELSHATYVLSSFAANI